MPLLGFAISQPCCCFFNNLEEFRSDTIAYCKFVVSNDRGLGSAFYWKPFCITKKKIDFGRVEVRRGGLRIKAVATFEIASKNEGAKGYQNILRMEIDSGRSNPPAFELKSSSEDSKEVNEREKLRRMRISKANKGNTPWNKGRKHSPETLQRIKERTRLAMQDPKIKMKLVNLGHAQSEETRIKIGMGVRLGWERRRERLMLQETCHYQWLNLIAEAARKGFLGEEELQWDSYKTLSKQLEQEWVQSVEERKNMPRSKGNKRAPKSAEQKRRISEAIAAKWADPEYRDRVCSGLAKFHGTSERVERKPRVKRSGDRQSPKRSPMKKADTGNLEKHGKIQVQRPRLKRPKAPSYKDPFASSKLEMIKNIRAQRAASVNKRSEAIFRAKLLIAEAEKAAAALETAAQSSPHIQASLAESRMLIAEAVQFIESIENDEPVSYENRNDLPDNSTEPEPHDEETTNPNNQIPDVVKPNGVHSSFARQTQVEDFSLDKFAMPDLVNGNGPISHRSDPPVTQEALHQASFIPVELNHEVNSVKFAKEHSDELLSSELELNCKNARAPHKDVRIIKKWVRGKLVEVVEES